MRLPQHPEATAAILLVGLAALNAALGTVDGWPQGTLLAAPLPRPLPPVGSSARKDMDWCLQNVSMVHDVYWASACAVDAQQRRARRLACLAQHPASADCEEEPDPDEGSSDCTLPQERAGPLNAARARAEQQCFDEAAAR